MHILLPPSESKRDGGYEGSALDVSGLSFSGLTKIRRTMLAAVRSLSSNRAKAAAALGLSAAQYFEVDRNRALRRSPVLPAIDRYTGVLYDALDARSLDERSRNFAADHMIIHSALFGLLGALDLVPAYRLSHDSRVPGHPLGSTWRQGISAELAGLTGLVLDLRSQSYVALGPAPKHSYFLRVVTVESGGARRALNHFNKKAKGEFVRQVLVSALDHATVDSLLTWCSGQGIRLEESGPGQLQLVV